MNRSLIRIYRITAPLRRRRRLLMAGAAVLILGVAAARATEQWDQVSENDARIMSNMITVSSRVEGWLNEVDVDDGMTIAQGQSLAVLDPRQAQEQVSELRSRVDANKVAQDELAIRIAIAKTTTTLALDSAEAKRREAEANLAANRSEADRAQAEFVRTQALLSESYASRQTWESRKAVLGQADGKARASSAQVRAAATAQQDAQARLADVEVLRLQLEELRREGDAIAAQLHQKQIDLQDRAIASPQQGVVDRRFVRAGEYVRVGQRMFLIHDPADIWIEANVKETKLADIRTGQNVRISVDAYPGQTFSGKVERIGDSATSQFALLPSANPSGNFTKIAQRIPVRIAVAQSDRFPLRPGMMVEVDIDAGQP